MLASVHIGRAPDTATVEMKRVWVVFAILLLACIVHTTHASRLKNPTKGEARPLERRSQRAIPELVKPGSWPGTVDREEGVFRGQPRAGCVAPLCDEGRPDILQASDDLVRADRSRVSALYDTRELAVQDQALTILEEALQSEADYICSGISPTNGAGLASGRSRFLFSRSYLDSSETCTSGNQVPCYSTTEQINSTLGLYTRFGLQAQVSGLAPLQGTGGKPGTGQDHVFSTEVRFVASESSVSTSQGTCATFSGECPQGVSCESIQETVISVTVANVRAAYKMNRMCPTSTGSQGKAHGTGSCRLPYAYAPFDSSDASLDPDAASVGECQTGVFSDRDDGYSIVDTPCEPPSSAQSETSAILDSVCGVMRDPDTGLPNELNRRCAKAICGICTASGLPTPSSHKRYAAGPATYAFTLGGLDRLIGDVTVTVSSSPSGTNPGGTRTVVLNDIDLDQVAMNQEGDNVVRVSVMGFRASTRLPLPDLNGGLVTVTVYDDDDVRGGMLRQASSPGENPWTLFPNNGAGLTPTATQMNTSFSWAYYPSSERFGDVPGAYGESQEMMTSPEAEFGSNLSCFSGTPVGEYYDEYRLVPGVDAGRGGTSLSDPPLVYTPCQKTHIYNTISTELLASTAPGSLTYDPSLHLFPGWNLLLPNYWIYDDYVYYQLPDAAPLRVYENSAYVEPSNIFEEGSAEGATSFVPGTGSGAPALADYIVGSGDLLGYAQSLVGTVSTAIEVAVDVSTDLVNYTGQTSAATVLATGTGCVVVGKSSDQQDSLAFQAYGTATVQNEDPNNSQQYIVKASCTAVSAGQVEQVTTPVPEALPLFVPAQSVGQTAPYSFQVTPFNSTASPTTIGKGVRCTFSVFYIVDGSEPFLLDSYETPCIGAPAPDIDEPYNELGCGKDQCYEYSYSGDGQYQDGQDDGDGSGPSDAMVLMLIGVSIVGVVILGAIGIFLLVKCEQEK